MIKIVLNEEAYDDDLDVDFLIYYYVDEGYEGYGNALFYKDGNWYTHYLGHCSCYGPFEEVDFEEPYEKLIDAIKYLHNADWSKSFDKDIEEMYNKAKEWFIETNLSLPKMYESRFS